MDWRPIETAPKDGTVVDIWMVEEANGWREANAYFVVQGTEDLSEYTDGSYRAWSIKRDGWWAPGHNYDGAPYFCDSSVMVATHWMPLPSPPA